jgi:hypothetical protein
MTMRGRLGGFLRVSGQSGKACGIGRRELEYLSLTQGGSELKALARLPTADTFY